MTELLQPIDAVVTWVDGADPAHRAKLNAYLESIGHIPEAAHPTRFRETGEFEFCIASMLRYAPWLRKIYILTDNQTPGFMSMVSKSPNSERIIVVDHKTVFEGYEQYLPTFNSRSLGTILWRIPGLADHFLILGDDQVLLQEVWPEDFFRGDKMVVRGGWHAQYDYRWDLRLKKLFNIGGTKKNNNIIPRPGMRMGQASAGIIAGYKKKYFRMPHNHQPHIK